MTWHEDREITPGVPDLSYVMTPDGHQYETGWLELKAEETKDGVLQHDITPRGARLAEIEVSFQIEPSQVSWIGRHGALCPIHLLLAVDNHWFLVPHGMVESLASAPITVLGLWDASVHIPPSRRPEVLGWALRAATRVKRVR